MSAGAIELLCHKDQQQTQRGIPVTSVEAREALVGRFAVNEDNSKVRIIGVFNIARDGVAVTVALVCFPTENDLSLRTIDGLFEDFSVFLDEASADKFIAGHLSRDMSIHEGTVEFERLAEEDAPVACEPLGVRIRAARDTAKLTAAELGKIVGVSAQTVKKWEKGGTSPAPKQLVSLERALGVRLALDNE